MEETKHATDIFYVFRCSGTPPHQIVRKSQVNNAPCHKCEREKPFTLVRAVPRKEGESEVAHFCRASLMKEAK